MVLDMRSTALRSADTDILLDGGENVDLFTATVGQSVPLDTVQEFSVLTNNFTAEYGRAGGGVVNVATKSGSNKFHGSLYEFNRLSALAANTYNNRCANGIAKPGFTRNQFGYSIGGPIVKNKLFFFSGTEWTRVRSSATVTQGILDPAFLALPEVNGNTKAFFNNFGSHLRPGLAVLSECQLAASKWRRLPGALAVQCSLWTECSILGAFGLRRRISAEHLLHGQPR